MHGLLRSNPLSFTEAWSGHTFQEISSIQVYFDTIFDHAYGNHFDGSSRERKLPFLSEIVSIEDDSGIGDLCTKVKNHHTIQEVTSQTVSEPAKTNFRI